ncbi:hypothetical protein HQQ94_05405 [Shewanella sp. VB17]|uniref:hypothetical protein n=1 Tax=Shewanella sp. VB17 TaxID=2739432 RepID=UPI001566F56C|nr:hypothetical protein [Shewanella sp. VB17]NRD72693.1 hypothetical protein [Shewanella sp. VB17]
MSTQETGALIKSVNNMTATVAGKMGEIDKKVNAAKSSFNSWMDTTKAVNINGEGRYVTELEVDGDKDTFYPVYFRMETGEETKIEVYRHYTWNKGKNDFDTSSSHIASALVVLRGQSYSWDGDANYLRTLVNVQRYRQTVAKVGFKGWCDVEKLDPNGPDSDYNSPDEGYISRAHSCFMLRGGRLKYRITSNSPLTFKVYQEGDEFYRHEARNFRYIAKTVQLADAESGDADNNHGTTYVGYNLPVVAPLEVS